MSPDPLGSPLWVRAIGAHIRSAAPPTRRERRLSGRAAFLLIAGASLFLGLVEIAQRVVAWAG